MKRLTEKAPKPSVNSQYVKRKGFYTADCIERLGMYEDTGLTPPEIMKLKERDTAKAAEEVQDAFGDGRLICPNCRNSVINYFNRSRPPRFCMICGQRLKFGE